MDGNIARTGPLVKRISCRAAFYTDDWHRLALLRLVSSLSGNPKLAADPKRALAGRKVELAGCIITPDSKSAGSAEVVGLEGEMPVMQAATRHEPTPSEIVKRKWGQIEFF
jgi:hypothetical protein